MNHELEFLVTILKVKRNFQEAKIRRLGSDKNIQFECGKIEAYEEMIFEIERIQIQPRGKDESK